MAVKLPRFFCEFCGAEVKRNDKVCHKCGKFFAAVRCPSCGLTGGASIFAKGCPSCGYAVLPNTRSTKSSAAKKRLKRARKTYAGKRKPQAAGDPLPLWVYVVVGSLFAFVVIAIIRGF